MGSLIGWSIRQGLACCLALALMLAQIGPGYAQVVRPQGIAGTNAVTAGRQEGPAAAPDQLGPMSNAEVQGFGCLTAGAATLGLTAFAGPNELVLAFAGGSVLPTTAIGLAVIIGGTIFASACAVGAIAAPALLRLSRHYYEGVPYASTTN